MGVGILAKRVVLELGSSTNFVYSLKQPVFTGCFFHNLCFNSKFTGRITDRHHKYCLFRFVNPAHQIQSCPWLQQCMCDVSVDAIQIP